MARLPAQHLFGIGRIRHQRIRVAGTARAVFERNFPAGDFLHRVDDFLHGDPHTGAEVALERIPSLGQMIKGPGMGIGFIFDTDDERQLIESTVEKLMIDSIADSVMAQPGISTTASPTTMNSVAASFSRPPSMAATLRNSG